MMRKKHSIVAVLAMFSSTAFAQQTVQAPGVISGVHVMGNGSALFVVSGQRIATPACHIQPNRWAFNANTPAGQAMLSLILTAYSAGKQIIVVGAGTCDAWPDTESVSFAATAD